MNEYNGFKVGDKVEVTKKPSCWTSGGGRSPMNEVYPISGAISNIFNDDYCPTATINGFGFDIETLVKENCIKKLPKYAVGDVVRRNNKQLIKCEITSVDQLCDETYVYTLSDCGSARFSESMLIPFDGLRVGDTVFTIKRGKGVVRGLVTWSKKDIRPYAVFFDKCGWKYPKKENLIPTEAKYKEALNKTGYAFKIDVAVVDEYDPKDSVAKHFEKIEKAAQAMNLIHSAAKIWANAFGRTTDQIKFPSGGVVHQCPPRYGFYKDGLPIDPICVIKSWQPPAPNPYFGQVQVAPSFSKKPTYTRSAEGKLEVVDGGVEKKYRCSKFAVHELVSYAGCIRAVVDKIHYKDGKFTYDLRTNSCSEGLPEDSLSAVVAHSAKFKVGDSVYYRGLRLIIESIWISIDNGPMYLIRPNGYACSVQESDLRLWKETKIKAILDDDTKNMIDTPCELSVFFDKFNVKHVGKNTIGDDVFVLTSKRFNTVRILFGIKGDDWV